MAQRYPKSLIILGHGFFAQQKRKHFLRNGNIASPEKNLFFSSFSFKKKVLNCIGKY